MYRKNISGQFIGFQLVLAASGAPATGLTPWGRRCIDGAFADVTGTFTEDSGTTATGGATGHYKLALAQADTNGNNISITVHATGAIPVCVNFITTAADPTDGVRLGLTALPNAAAGASGGLPLGDSAGKVALQADQAVNTTKINGTSQTAGDVVSVANSIKTQTDKMAFSVTNQIDANVIDWKGAAAPAMTGDAFAAVGALSIPTADANADALLDRTAGVETNRTLRQAMRLMLAALAGKLSGADTTTVTIRDTNDSVNRIVATVDANGNRSSLTLNAG